MLAFSVVFVAILSISGVLAAPLKRQANPCFITGNTALPAEVADQLAGLSAVTCDTSVGICILLGALSHANSLIVNCRSKSYPVFLMSHLGAYRSATLTSSSQSCPLWDSRCPLFYFLCTPHFANVDGRQEFATPTDPATADLDTLQNQLNVYLAVEAGIRVRTYITFTEGN